MLAIFLGVGVGVCEFIIDKWKGVRKPPSNYFKDMCLVCLTMTLLKILEGL